MSVQIQLRRDTAAAWTAANPTLAEGEWGFETDTKFLKIGDGTTAWNSLAYFGAGAPTGADYLVGTAHAGLSAEIVVGTTPGGELGGTWASPTVDTTHSGSSHAGVVSAHEAASDPHIGYLKEADIAAKGDLFVGTANDTVGILSAGADYARLRYRAGATAGIEVGERYWSAISTADVARGNNVSGLADITGLTLTLPGSLSILWFELAGMYQSNNTAMGFNCSMNAGGGTMFAYKKIMSSATGPTFTEGLITALDGNGGPTTSTDVANTSRPFWMSGYIISPTGTLAARFANETATSGQGVTVMAGAVLRVWMA